METREACRGCVHLMPWPETAGSDIHNLLKISMYLCICVTTLWTQANMRVATLLLLPLRCDQWWLQTNNQSDLCWLHRLVTSCCAVVCGGCPFSNPPIWICMKMRIWTKGRVSKLQGLLCDLCSTLAAVFSASSWETQNILWSSHLEVGSVFSNHSVQCGIEMNVAFPRIQLWTQLTITFIIDSPADYFSTWLILHFVFKIHHNFQKPNKMYCNCFFFFNWPAVQNPETMTDVTWSHLRGWSQLMFGIAA